MALEIERKYLLVSDEWRSQGLGKMIRQGYLSREPERTVRVRICDEQAYMTVKGLAHGITRVEIEFAISLDHANELMSLCLQPLIEKTRYEIWHAGMKWEVDEFHGANAGLIVAEIELPSEETTFEKPVWCGKEVSQDFRYANSYLSQHPYAAWRDC
jgi:adenylate cyclase